MSTGKFFVGFLVGGAVGAVIGLLLAPKSGQETRELIAETSKDIYSKAESAVNEFKEKASDVVADVQQRGEEMIDSLQSFINKQKDA